MSVELEMILDIIVGTTTSIKKACEELDFDFIQTNTPEFREELAEHVDKCPACGTWTTNGLTTSDYGETCCDYCYDEYEEYDEDED